MDQSSNIQSSKITQTRILEIVRRVAAKPVDPAPDESLFESGLLDSFSLTDLVSELEAEFSIRVPDADLTPRKFDSIARIQAYLESRG
jgi:acyl carrier protein